ncbi:AAA family ATPase [Paenibacillus solani]|uniref:AAA family ATPase n=1 Tax=Paenibacillus solani TaxID=1705565 RepID=UPI003D2A6CBB
MIISSGRKLKDFITNHPIALADLIELSIILSEMVLREHQQSALIGGLSPFNVIIQWEEKKAYIMEIGEGHPAYKSPEQSGRINRVPDERSDLYALGVIIYELMTGQLPFLPESGEDWSTVHIRKTPRLLSDNRPEEEGPLQAILMKLLSKSPEDRYQTVYGLLDDLKRYQEMLNNGRLLVPFELGRLDKIRSLGVPDAWYGRSEAVERMEAGLEQAVQGKNALLWVTGQKGVGKTVLVRRLQSNVVRQGGRFVEGEAETGQQSTSYEPILQAMRQWVHQLWSEPTDVISELKMKLQAKYGQEAQEIVSFLPEAKPLFEDEVGISSALNDKRGQDRCGEYLPDLVRCMAECKPPLVLFVDNLEWADSGTHAVIRSLVLEREVPGLFLIGACRTEEGGVSSLSEPSDPNQAPAASWLAERWCMNPEEHISLQPLHNEDVSQYVSDALHEESARIRLLARSVYDQTGGNPRAIRLLLEHWQQEKRLGFDEIRRQWTWDPEVTRQLGALEANIRAMEASFNRLPDDKKELLVMAAAVGPVFRPSILAEACDILPDVVIHSLQEAEMEGLIYHEDHGEQGDGQDRFYLFMDESIHQMVYAFDSVRNAQRHHKIGQLLQRRSPEWSEHLILKAIDHLNLASSVLTEHEVRQLAEHNLQAGKKALAEGRYAKGKEYAENGLRLSAELETGELYVQLQLVLAWTEHMVGHPEQARVRLVELNKNSGWMSRADRLSIWEPLIQLQAFVDNETAIQYGKEALAAYGWEIREKSSLLSIAKEVFRTELLLYRKRDMRYRLSDPLDGEYAELCILLMKLFFPLLMHDTGALVDLYARFIRFGLQKGVNESLAVIISGYELIVQRVLPSYRQALPKAGPMFMHYADPSKFKNQHLVTYVGGMSKQLDKPSEASVMLYKSMRQGLEAGDRDFANLAMITCVVTHNGDLYALKELLHYFEDNIRQSANGTTMEIVQIAGSYLEALQDGSLTESFVAISQASSSADVEPHEEDNYSCGCRLEVAYLSGNYREALYWAKQGRTNELPLDRTRIRKQRFYESLTLAAVFFEKGEEERKQIRRAFHHQLRKMKSWRGFLGHTSSAYLLMKAEGERIAGHPLSAVSGYMAAIRKAKTEEYTLMEGIACERLAACYREDLISRTGAKIALMDASAAYAEWGITFKVTQNRSQHAELLYPVPTQQKRQALEREIESDLTRIDLPRDNAQAEGIEAVSESEYELLRQLVDGPGKPKQASWTTSLLEASLQQSGADQALLLSHQEGGFTIEAKGWDIPEKEAASGMYAESVLRHTAMTGKPLVLDDAIGRFWIKDSYIQARQPRSILCMPIAVPGERISYLLYLENRQLPGVFTERDVKVLELAAARIIYVKLLEDEVGAAKIAGAEKAVPSFVSTVDPHELPDPLTEREHEILMAITEGLSNREIADRLGIAETTVKTHASRIISKLGVKRRGQAVVRARELGLIE